MNQVNIFVPVLVVVALTLIGLLRMAVARGRAVKSGQDPNYYRAALGTPEPEYAVVAVRHYGNLFEVPVLFYAGCLIAFTLSAVTSWVLIWAWGYALARLVQSAIHLTYNNPGHRGGAFMLGWLFMAALWVTVAMAIVARL